MLFVQPNLVYPQQPYPIFLLPNICSVVAPVCKIAPSGVQRCTQVKGATKKTNEKKKPSTLTQTTKTRWKGRYTCKEHPPPIFAHLQQLPQQFSSPNIDPNWQKSKKTRGVGWENVHKKLSHESNYLYFAYNIPLRLLYRSPPLTTLTSHYVHRNSGAQPTKTTTTASKEGNDQMEEDRSFFLPQTHRF